MTIIELLTSINTNYLVALAVLIGLVVEGLKQSQLVSVRLLPIVAGVLGLILGGLIGLVYQESFLQTSFNGLIVDLIASGGYDALKALWQLPRRVS